MGTWRQLPIMERATVKVVPAFRDFLKHIVSDPDFPVKSVHQLITLTCIKWIENYKKATKSIKMINCDWVIIVVPRDHD